MFKQPKYFILLIILVGSFLFFTQTLTVLALEERTSSVTSPYGFYQNDTGSYWDPMGGTIQGPEGLISKGNIDVLHRGEIGIEKKTVSVGDTIPFVYNPDKPFFTASGGLWDTPYGSWCAGINDRCFNDITSVGLYITSVYGNVGYVYFTGVKPPVELVSSDPAVLTCSGFSCLAKSPGQSQVIMKIGYTPIRGWARIHYRNFGVFSPEAIRNNYVTSVSVWSDVSEVGAYVTAYSYTNPRLFPSTKYGEVGPYEIITLNKTDFMESPEGSAIISNLNNVLVYSFFVYGGSSPDDIANFVMIMAGSINIDSTTIKKIVNDAVANGLGYSQDFKLIIKSALPEDITFSRLVSLQNQGYNDMVLPKTTLGPWTITVKNPDPSNKPPSLTVTATSPVKIGQDSTITMTADDHEGDSVKYCVSWNDNDSYDEKATASTDFVQDEGCFPSIGFAPNKESREVKQSWRSIGDKKVRVVAFDDKGNKSEWKEVIIKVEDSTTSCVKSNGGVEVCDGKDNDCNGIVDDGNPGGGGQCTASGLGQCRVGINQCIGGNLLCVGAAPSQETCGNGLDDDCDGKTDEDCSVTPPSTPKCNNNERCETYRGENPVNCPKDCPATIIETRVPKPSFWAFVLGALGFR